MYRQKTDIPTDEFPPDEFPPDESPPDESPTDRSMLARQLALGFGWCVWMWLFAVLHPFGEPGWRMQGAFGWLAIAGECVSLMAGPWVLVMLLSRFRTRPARIGDEIVLAAVPVAFSFDVLVYRWSGLHLISGDFFNLGRDHLPNLLAFFSWGMLVPVASVVASLLVGRWIAGTFARIVDAHIPMGLQGREKTGTRWRLGIAVAVGILGVVSGMSLGWQASDERRADRLDHPTRHPWTAFGLIPPPVPVLPVLPEFEYDRERFAEMTSNRIRQMRMNVVTQVGEQIGTQVVEQSGGDETDATSPAMPPDVLIIVYESLRPEMLASDTMPAASAAADSGMRLSNHFSGGNATSLGMFSIVSGLEAVWFYKSEVRFAPAMNRLFRQAGYETGFFAGHDDWADFQMDAFLSNRHFDRFEIEPMDWLDSDRRAISQTKAFLEEPGTASGANSGVHPGIPRQLRFRGVDEATSPLTPVKWGGLLASSSTVYPKTKARRNTSGRPPRLAMLFLYSTHAPFDVLAEQATDQPSASRDYPIPFPQSWRPSVWNRYRNAARTLDAEIADLITEDRITVLTGDHGESFLDDGTVGHGTKLSRAQTRVAAMICGPGVPAMQINERTMHADLLPTILSAANIRVSALRQFDGIDLLAPAPMELASRVFSVSNLVGRDCVLVGPNATGPGAVAGLRVRFSLLDSEARPLGPIDERGDRWRSILARPSDRGDKLLRRWMSGILRSPDAESKSTSAASSSL